MCLFFFKIMWFLQTLEIKDEVFLFVCKNDKLSLWYARFKKKCTLTRCVQGFFRQNILKWLDLVQTQRYRYLHTSGFKCHCRCHISIAAARINLLLLLGLWTHSKPFQLPFSKIFLMLRIVLKSNSWDIQRQSVGI